MPGEDVLRVDRLIIVQRLLIKAENFVRNIDAKGGEFAISEHFYVSWKVSRKSFSVIQGVWGRLRDI